MVAVSGAEKVARSSVRRDIQAIALDLLARVRPAAAAHQYGA